VFLPFVGAAAAAAAAAAGTRRQLKVEVEFFNV